MRKNFIQMLNSAPSSIVAYPLFFIILSIHLKAKFPLLNDQWAAYMTHQTPMPSLVIFAITWGFMAVIGYFYFKAIFSNYWSSSTLFILLSIVDLQAALVLLGSFLFLGLSDMVVFSSQRQQGSSTDRSAYPSNTIGTQNSLDSGLSRENESFSTDYVLGQTTGVSFSTGSAAGSSINSHNNNF